MKFRFEVDAENWRLHCLYADYLASFANAKERIAERVRHDKERALAAAEGRLYDWTVNEYWCELERKVEMAGARGRGRPTKPTQAQQLLEALDFIKDGSGDVLDWHKYVRLSGNMAISFNGQMAAGHPIAEEVALCPQLGKLTDALKRCGKSLVISETPNGALSIKGDKLRALVPALKDSAELPTVVPDPPIAVIGDIIKEAFKVCGSLSSEAGERMVEATLLLEANTCTSIGKGVQTMLQFWHGIDLPPHMVIPKAFAAAVAKQSKPLTGFGFSWRGSEVGSVTFWFDGGSWIKTQTYQDKWPDISRIIDVQSYPVEVLSGLFDAVEAVTHFNDDGHIVFAEGKVMSHESDGIGAQYEVAGLQGGKKFNGKFMKMVAGHVKSIDLTTYPDKAFFFGGEPTNPIRGVIMGLHTHVTHVEQPQPEPPGAYDQTASYTPCPACNDEDPDCSVCT
jgi:hypothetical protein